MTDQASTSTNAETTHAKEKLSRRRSTVNAKAYLETHGRGSARKKAPRHVLLLDPPRKRQQLWPQTNAKQKAQKKPVRSHGFSRAFTRHARLLRLVDASGVRLGTLGERRGAKARHNKKHAGRRS